MELRKSQPPLSLFTLTTRKRTGIGSIPDNVIHQRDSPSAETKPARLWLAVLLTPYLLKAVFIKFDFHFSEETGV